MNFLYGYFYGLFRFVRADTAPIRAIHGSDDNGSIIALNRRAVAVWNRNAKIISQELEELIHDFLLVIKAQSPANLQELLKLTCEPIGSTMNDFVLRV